MKIIKNIAVARTGVWDNQMTVTHRNLDQMILSHRKLTDFYIPLALYGSENAFGWITKLRRVGDVLYADFKGVPAWFADIIIQKKFRGVRLEVLPEYLHQKKLYRFVPVQCKMRIEDSSKLSYNRTKPRQKWKGVFL